MLKKCILGLLAIVLSVALGLTGYIYSKKVERNADTVTPISTTHNPRYRDKVLSAEQWLTSVYQAHLLPSLSVSIGLRGELVWEGVIGYSDVRTDTLASHTTEYRIGSVSKSITAAAAMRMHENNSLPLDSRFEDYVDDYPPENAGFTVKHLLAHQGGVRHYVSDYSEFFSAKEYPTLREAAAIVEDDALLFTPGTGFHYSTYGYTLLSLAMETAYSAPFETLMHQEVFGPIGMIHTHFDKANETPDENRATPYLHVGKALYESPKVDLSYKHAGGGFVSTPTDLIHFGHALLRNTLLREETKTLMWTPPPLENGEINPEYYALGFRVGQDESGGFVHHRGISVGGHAVLLIYPELEVVVALATNVTPADERFDIFEEAKRVMSLFSDQN